MKRLICIISIAVSMLAISSISHGLPNYLTSFNNTYPGTSGTTLNQCILCHTTSSGGPRNPYGTAYANAGHNFVTIEGADSDGDGFTNIAEINARTFPGDPNSKPAASPPPADTTPPTVSISAPVAGAVSGTITVSASVSDNVGVVGVQFKLDGGNLGAEDPTSPYSVSWNTTTATNASHTLTAVARDAAGNTTTSAGMTVAVSNVAPPPPPPPPPQDTTAPTVDVFTIPAQSNSLTVSISAFAASDNVGVIGVMVRESAARPSANTSGWVTSPPSSYTFPSSTTSGTKTLYAWAKDATGNVSVGVSATVTITLSAPQPPPPAPGPQVSMNIWTNTWFEVAISNQGVSAQGLGLTGENRKVNGYLNILSWNPDSNIFDATLYQHDQETGQWNSVPIPLSYASGGPLNLQVSAQTSGSVALGFNAQIKGTEKNGALRKATFKTLAGYLVQSGGNDESEGTNSRDAAGWLKINGKLVPESTVPIP